MSVTIKLGEARSVINLIQKMIDEYGETDIAYVLPDTVLSFDDNGGEFVALRNDKTDPNF